MFGNSKFHAVRTIDTQMKIGKNPQERKVEQRNVNVGTQFHVVSLDR